jgi:hypothetical protein
MPLVVELDRPIEQAMDVADDRGRGRRGPLDVVEEAAALVGELVDQAVLDLIDVPPRRALVAHELANVLVDAAALDRVVFVASSLAAEVAALAVLEQDLALAAVAAQLEVADGPLGARPHDRHGP